MEVWELPVIQTVGTPDDGAGGMERVGAPLGVQRRMRFVVHQTPLTAEEYMDYASFTETMGFNDIVSASALISIVPMRVIDQANFFPGERHWEGFFQINDRQFHCLSLASHAVSRGLEAQAVEILLNFISRADRGPRPLYLGPSTHQWRHQIP